MLINFKCLIIGIIFIMLAPLNYPQSAPPFFDFEVSNCTHGDDGTICDQFFAEWEEEPLDFNINIVVHPTHFVSPRYKLRIYRNRELIYSTNWLYVDSQHPVTVYSYDVIKV